MPNTTTNFGYSKPLVNDATDEDLWGGYLNTNLDSQDGDIYTAQRAVTVTKTGTYTTLAGDKNKLILGDATSAAFSINLLSAATAGAGFRHNFKKIDATTNAVTIDASGAETIDGALTFVLSNQNDAVTLVSDGTNWQITGRNQSQVSTPMTTQYLTTVGAGTYTTPANCKRIKIRAWGGGGGGSSSSLGTLSNGGNGGDTIFNGIHAKGGVGGIASVNGSTGGAGTTSGTGAATFRAIGNAGTNGTSGASGIGGAGGGTALGGGGAPGGNTVNGITPTAGAANTGAGGGGGQAAGGGFGGGGGQAGEYFELVLSSPLAPTYSFTIGAAGVASPTGSQLGAAGSIGMIMVEEYY